jgi:hypothetical protein
VNVDTGAFTKLTADVERLVTDLAAMRGELATFGKSVTRLRTGRWSRSARRRTPGSGPARPGGPGTCAWSPPRGGRHDRQA